MKLEKNTLIKLLGIIFILFPTIYILLVGMYFYPILFQGVFYQHFYQLPHYSFIPDSQVDQVFIIVNILFFGTFILTWSLIFVKRFRHRFPVLFLISSIVPLLLLVLNSRLEPKGRMLSLSGNSEIRFIEEVDGHSIISVYQNEKKSIQYDPDERPKWKLVRKDTVPETP